MVASLPQNERGEITFAGIRSLIRLCESLEVEISAKVPAAAPAATCSGIVGYWTPVAEKMPDDEITVLVWVSTLDDATLAYHCSEVLERHGYSGWVLAGHARAKRVLLGVTHWCSDICPPKIEDHPP